MTVHSLTKSAIFFAVGHAAQKTGTQVIDDIRGLIMTNPTIGWGLMLGSLAILGMPPFGVFASEFLILTTAMREQRGRRRFCCSHWASRSPRSSARCRDGVRRHHREAPAAFARAGSRVRASRARADARPLYPALSCRVVPPGRATARMTRCEQIQSRTFAPLPRRRCRCRADVDAIEWLTACRQVHERGGRLVSLVGQRTRRAGFAVHAALAAADGLLALILPAARGPAGVSRI